jgi:hypothetical protein
MSVCESLEQQLTASDACVILDIFRYQREQKMYNSILFRFDAITIYRYIRVNSNYIGLS